MGPSRTAEPMKRRRRLADDEPLLFDLPLRPPERVTSPAGSPAARREPVQPALFAEPATAVLDEAPAEVEVETEAEHPPRYAPSQPEPEPSLDVAGGPIVAGIPARFLAGCADALLHLGGLAAAYLGLIALDVEPRLGQWPGLAALLLAFSFLSSVVSLAFWGQTAGMAWRGLQSRDRLQRALTFRQAVLRWVGGLLTFAAAGLPLLLALGRGSLADLLSRSVTYQARG